MLHRVSLSPRFIREISLDIETMVYGKDLKPQTQAKHTFVSGLARSGTTIILRTLYESDEYASLTYADMPFVMAPNSWMKLQKTQTEAPATERAHGDGIMVTTSAPEAFEEVYWNTFDEQEALEGFSNYIGLILKRYEKQRYLSKNNQNVKRLGKLVPLFPNAMFLIPFRDPLQHCQSLFSQHQRFSAMQAEDSFVKDYMDWIGHSEFGVSYRPIVAHKLDYPDNQTFDHWLEQWTLLYSSLMAQHHQDNNVCFICYERLCSDPGEWAQLLERLELDTRREFIFKESLKPVKQAYSSELLSKAQAVYAELSALSSTS